MTAILHNARAFLFLVALSCFAATTAMAESVNYWYDGNRKIPLSLIQIMPEANGRAIAYFQVAGSGTEMQTDGAFYICYPLNWTDEQIHSLELAHALTAADVQLHLQGIRFYAHTDPVAGVALANLIYEEGNVLCASPRWLRQIRRRTSVSGTDPLLSSQWQLLNSGQNSGLIGADINASPAWESTMGERTTIAILDDGFDASHPDLFENALPSGHFDFITNQPYLTGGTHGTAVAGIAAARGFNQIGGRGVAPLSSLLGVRILDESGRLDDFIAAQGLLYASERADVINNSWGPPDGSFHAFEGPSPIARQAIDTGIMAGRHGLGNIFVFASGNGGASDDSNLDGYANMRQVIAVGSTTNVGTAAVYSEAGSNILVNAPSGGGTLNILTTDLSGGTLGYNVFNTVGDMADRDYTNLFSGSSAAAPMVSGVAALMLSATTTLNWREVKQTIASTATRNDPTHTLWKMNGAGYWINEQYGFGRINAAAAVALATSHHTIQPEMRTNPVSRLEGLLIPDANPNGLVSQLLVAEDIRIEHVEVAVDIPDHTYWGDLSMYLTSPDGTTVRLVKSHFIDTSARVLGYHNWTMTTPLFLGENSRGNWALRVVDEKAPDTGTLASWSIVAYGTRIPNLFAELPYSCTGRSMLQPNLVKPAAIAQGISVQGALAAASASGSSMEDYRIFFAISPLESLSARQGLSIALHEGSLGNVWYMRTDNGWVEWDASMQTLQGFSFVQSQNKLLSIYEGHLAPGRYSIINAYRSVDDDIIFCSDSMKIIVN